MRSKAGQAETNFQRRCNNHDQDTNHGADGRFQGYELPYRGCHKMPIPVSTIAVISASLRPCAQQNPRRKAGGPHLEANSDPEQVGDQEPGMSPGPSLAAKAVYLVSCFFASSLALSMSGVIL
jgi:hypothetical protein